MPKRTVSGITLTLLLLGMLTLAFNIQPVNAGGTIYIRADGSVYPDTAPISSVDNVTYTFTGNINDEIVVGRDNIVVDGAGYIVQGTGSGRGIDLSYRNNVTIKNTEIKSFWTGIELDYSFNNMVSGNNVTNNEGSGIHLRYSNSCTFTDNTISENWAGMCLEFSKDNIIYHNNFINNEYKQTWVLTLFGNTWDNGYPSGGNYWSDHSCIGNPSYGWPYFMRANNIDRYPFQDPNGWLLKPHQHELAVALEAPAFLELGDSSLLNATVFNAGLNNETDVDLFLLINEAEVNHVTIPELVNGTSYTIDYLWTPTVEGTYNVTAYAPPVPGENITANNRHTKSVHVLVKGEETIVAVGPPAVTVAVGQTFSIDITITDVENLWSYIIDLSWNASVLECTEVKEGPFMKNVATTIFLSRTPQPGYIPEITCCMFAIGVGASGSGVLATVTFNATGIGETDLHIGGPLAGEPDLVTPPPDVDPIPVTVVDGHVKVLVDVTPPNIIVFSPENIMYTTTSVPLTFTVNEYCSWIGYSLDNQANVTITGNTTLTGLSEGSHSITVYANDTSGNMGASDTVYFIIALPAVPVGGYSLPIKGYTAEKPLTLYLALAAILATVFTMIKRKTRKRTK